MDKASAGGGGSPVVFWGRMLLLTPVSCGLVFAANLLFATATLIVYLEPLKLPSTWPFILLTLALGVGFLVGGVYLARGMWQYYRGYVRSQPVKRAARTATAFLVCTTAILAALCLAINWRAYSAYRKHENEIEHAAKQCPMCGEYAVEHRPYHLSPSTAHSLLNLDRIGDDYYGCRHCDAAFVMGYRGVLIESRKPSCFRSPLTDQDAPADQTDELGTDHDGLLIRIPKPSHHRSPLPAPDASADQTDEEGAGPGRSPRFGIW